MNVWLQITSGQGPVECQWVVARVMEIVASEAVDAGIRSRVLEITPGEQNETVRSVLLSLDGDKASSLADTWTGTIQWIGQSPFRKNQKRKNWFVGIEAFRPPQKPIWSENELRFETMRSSGPGGQNVNKTSSAVRLIHVPTGLAVVAREERSQPRNRSLALARLARIMEQKGASTEAGQRSERWLQHASLERGNAVRVFRGADFRLNER